MHSLGSCVLHLHIDNKAFPTIFEVTNMTGPIILGRTQAKTMSYVQFLQIWWPHALTTFPTTLRKLCMTKTPTSDCTLWYNSHHQSYSTQSISAQKQVHKGNTSKIIKADYRTSTTTNKMEHRLHRTQW